MFVCVCKGITESDVRKLGSCGMTCPRALASNLEIDDADNCCGRCMNNISEFVTLAKEGHAHHQSSVTA